MGVKIGQKSNIRISITMFKGLVLSIPKSDGLEGVIIGHLKLEIVGKVGQKLKTSDEDLIIFNSLEIRSLMVLVLGSINQKTSNKIPIESQKHIMMMGN